MIQFSDWLTEYSHIGEHTSKKEEILRFWQSLNPSMPLQVQPMRAEHEGSSFTEDGIRLTGSEEFITSVMSRLKEFINYERGGTKLHLMYKTLDETPQSNPDFKANSHALYIQVKQK